MEKNISDVIRDSVYIALFISLISVGAHIKIPTNIPGSPIYLANFFIILSAVSLGSKRGFLTVVIYLLLGLFLPVFQGGGSGPAHFAGSTGGFLFSFPAAAFIIGFIAERGKQGMLKNYTALTAGTIVIYAIGLPWLKFNLDFSMQRTIAVAAIYIPFDIIKIAAAGIMSKKIREITNSDIEIEK